MSPRQCDAHQYHSASTPVDEVTSAARETQDALDRGTLELLQFADGQMLDHETMVAEFEAIVEPDVRAQRRRQLLDSLVAMSHVAHRFLRHGHADVRQAAEALTTGTAHLIGRIHTAPGETTDAFDRRIPFG